MSGPIVLGLPPEDVQFVLDLLSDCAAQCNREYKRACRDPRLECRAEWRGRGDTARDIMKEIKRQERACRKAMRDGNYA